MKRREENLKNREVTPSSNPTRKNEVAKFELPLDLDDILAVAVFDTLLRVKRRKLRSRGSARRKQ